MAIVTLQEEILREWKQQHECWVRRGGFVSCTCGFSKTVVSGDPYSVKDEHLKATMPKSIRAPQIGHWEFVLELTRSKRHQRWTCRCTLCGHAVGCIDFAGTVVPLTGSLYRQRRAHDKKTHPEKLLEQKKAENVLLGKP
jgi:hypothetical protein